MSWKQITTVLSLLFVCYSTWAQEGFRSPVDVPLYLSGTFGEPRGSHFHSGIDIRTNGKEGLNVYAIEDGYISRIKVSAHGYGNALYIAHPNGCTSVYAHLQRFNERIAAYIKKIHYQKESFELDEYLPTGELSVTRGEIIGLSGNSGGSGGPHLHFEIRDTKSQVPVNPHQHGYKVDDRIAPGIYGIYFYPKNANLEPFTMLPTTRNSGNAALALDTIIVNTDTLGLGVHTTDKMNGAPNTNGVYGIELRVDDKPWYAFQMDRFAFDDTRYVQCHMDYAQKVKNRNSVHRLFQLPGNYLDRVYAEMKNNGYLALQEGVPQKVFIESRDHSGNKTEITFYVKYVKEANFFKPNTEPFDTVFYPHHSNTFQHGDIQAKFASNTFYNKVYWKYDEAPSTSTDIRSPLYSLHYEWEPVHKRYSVSIKPDVPADQLESLILVRKDSDGDLTTYPSYVSNGWVTARPKDLGDFYLAYDTIKPTIEPRDFYNNKDVSGQDRISLTIKDNLTDIDNYKGTINGKWVLFRYDAKNDHLWYEFDENLSAGEHTVSISVTDEVGNEATYHCTIKK